MNKRNPVSMESTVEEFLKYLSPAKRVRCFEDRTNWSRYYIRREAFFARWRLELIIEKNQLAKVARCSNGFDFYFEFPLIRSERVVIHITDEEIKKYKLGEPLMQFLRREHVRERQRKFQLAMNRACVADKLTNPSIPEFMANVELEKKKKKKSTDKLARIMNGIRQFFK